MLIPVIAAVSYELLRFGARHRGNAVMRAFFEPGIWVQKITTKQPTDDMIEVAIVSMEQAMAADGEELPSGSGTIARSPLVLAGAPPAPAAGGLSRGLARPEAAGCRRPVRVPAGASWPCPRRRPTRTRSAAWDGSWPASSRSWSRSAASRRSAAELAGAREMRDAEADEEMRTMARDEVVRLESAEAVAIEELKVLLLPRDPNDDRNVILEIRAGAGGEEAALFAGDLLRMYLRWAERHRFRAEVMTLNETGIGGVKEAVVEVSGDGAYSRLKYESGTHRVQRIPATESSGRIHTSTATVVALPEAEEADLAIDEERDLRIEVKRASGPGGQGVNTTDSAVRITHLPPGSSSRSRTSGASTRTRRRRWRSCAPALPTPSA